MKHFKQKEQDAGRIAKQGLYNGPIWTDHHQQHSSIITPCADCYLPSGSTNQWLAMLYGPMCDLHLPEGPVGGHAALLHRPGFSADAVKIYRTEDG